MKYHFVPYGVYDEIIQELGRWKVLDTKRLSKKINLEVTYKDFLKKVKRLEKFGLIKSVLFGSKSKYVYLSDKGIRFTKYDSSYEIKPENLNHDLIVSRTLEAFLEMDNFVDGQMFHQIMEREIYPDAKVTGTKNAKKYNMALEIELTQKSRSRVIEKYNKYAISNHFNYVLFVTNKESIFKAYTKYIDQLKDEVRKSVIIMLDLDLNINRANLKNGHCYYMGRGKSFNNVFGEKSGA